MGFGSFFSSLKKLFSNVAANIIAGVVLTVGLTGVGYMTGRDQGLAQGGAIAEKHLADRQREQREEFERDLREREHQFEQQRKAREEEFRASLDDLVEERYREALLKQQSTAQRAGSDQGYAAGRAAGQRECEATYKAFEESRSAGLLWEQFSWQVRSLKDKNLKTDGEIKAAAYAIVDISRQGRSSASVLAAQLNGLVDSIEEALKANDLAKARELIEALALTLDAKAAIWRNNYRTLSQGAKR